MEMKSSAARLVAWPGMSAPVATDVSGLCPPRADRPGGLVVRTFAYADRVDGLRTLGWCFSTWPPLEARSDWPFLRLTGMARCACLDLA